jgi:cyclic di-GMP phosphodiesterase Gmr
MNNPEMSSLSPPSPPGERDATSSIEPVTRRAEPAEAGRPPGGSQDGESDAREAVRFLHALIDELPVALRLQGEDGKTLLANAMAAELSRSEVAGADEASPTASAGDGTSRGGLGSTVPKPVATVTTEDRAVGPRGERTVLEVRKPLRIASRSFVLSASFDITERKRLESELSKRAYFDDLTGLPNRRLIQEHVELLLESSQTPWRFALAFLDIDNFKHINDYYTHAIGDALLVKVAERISSHIRPSDILARISGDEFLLVISPAENDQHLANLVASLLQQLKEPFLIEGFEILTSASIGLSVYPDHGLSYEMLRRAADSAMYRVKEGAKGGAALFDTDMGRAMTFRMAQEQRLRLAVRDGRFCCAFQPKVDIRSQEVVGVEALIRLRDENGLIQAPGEFIGLATELGLIDDLTFLALGQIVGSMELIDEAFGAATRVSINIAARQAGDLALMRTLCQELDAAGFADRFIIEVTEDAFLAKSLFQKHVVPMLREIGTRVSIDDFGTGYSSLSALADITADEIKIDRSFITDIHRRPRSQSVLKAIEALSEPLGMTVVAEGVETFEEAAYLQAATRIRFAQGYYFSRPIFLEDLQPAKRGPPASRVFSTSREKSPLRGQS